MSGLSSPPNGRVCAHFYEHHCPYPDCPRALIGEFRLVLGTGMTEPNRYRRTRSTSDGRVVWGWALVGLGR